MDEHNTMTILVLIILVALSAYFSATETAFSSLNRIRIKNAANAGNHRAKRVLHLSEHYDKLLSTILIGNNIVNISMTALATLLFVGAYGKELGATISTVVVTIVVLIFGEISPKSLAKESPEKFAMFSAPIIRVFIFILTPVNMFFTLWKKMLTKIFKVSKDRTITEDELLIIVEEAENEGGIDEQQSELIQNAIEFSELEAFDVLTPRVDVEAIDIDNTKEEIRELFLETGFSRLPVYEDTIDKIIGVLNQKDFHNYILHSSENVSEYVKPVVFISGTVKIAMLLKKMQKVKTHIAVVVDEYGGTEGIVTMEDIIEELVGEIYDEHDEITTQEIVELQDGSYRVLCSANLEKMLEHFAMDDEFSDVMTVNGWVVVELDKIPEPGDFFQYKNLKVRVTKAEERRALEINIIDENKKDSEEL
ncbi:MAG: HlyC/CorC family transporter [Peptostreptococcaceae bacterium]|nr:HlyC/CorC family transporter [Peptostreptococcaceae bacterium]